MDTELHLLDVGHLQYGDAIVCLVDGRSILVDGAHPGDSELIADQLREVLGAETPMVDLLVISHAHDDHIGCLPQLVEEGTLRAEHALVPSVELSWPADEREASADHAAVLAGLREEDLSALADDELELTLESARSLRTRYTGMLATLRESGATVVEYSGEPPAQILDAFSDVRLEVLGPDQRHLRVAAAKLGASVKELRETLSAAADRPSIALMSRADLYRALNEGRDEAAKIFGVEALVGAAEAAARAGAAVNAESIVVAVGEPGGRVLLTGDMQFAEPGFADELGDAILSLWTRVTERGPYNVTKLAHHGSYNGSPRDVANALGCHAFGICTGSDSRDHPSCGVIDMLAEDNGNRWVRTDSNGHSVITFHGGEATVTMTNGAENDPACR